MRERVEALCEMQRGWIAKFRGDTRFQDVRQLGTITALDVVARDAGYLAGVGPLLYDAFMARGVLLRPLGNTIYVMPPYCIDADQLATIYNAIVDVVSGLD